MCLKNIILLIYPYTPFIAEELYQNLPQHLESIMLEKYPTYDSNLIDESVNNEVTLLFDFIRDVRAYKIENKLAPNAKLDLVINLKINVFDDFLAYLRRFTFAENIELAASKEGTLYVHDFGDLLIKSNINKDEIKSKLLKEIEVEQSEILRGEKMLSNPGFISKAPQAKIDIERNKLEQHKKNLISLQEKLNNL
jgi:valyl-tRNA synthetase